MSHIQQYIDNLTRNPMILQLLLAMGDTPAREAIAGLYFEIWYARSPNSGEDAYQDAARELLEIIFEDTVFRSAAHEIPAHEIPEGTRVSGRGALVERNGVHVVAIKIRGAIIQWVRTFKELGNVDVLEDEIRALELYGTVADELYRFLHPLGEGVANSQKRGYDRTLANVFYHVRGAWTQTASAARTKLGKLGALANEVYHNS